MKGLIKSFGYAFRGIWFAVQNERNMRVHITFMVYMYFFLCAYDFFTVSKTQFAILFLANAAVLAAELFNTAIERAVDLAAKGERNETAKVAKDAAAGAVLVFAVFSVAVGIAILYQPAAFHAMFVYFKTHILSLSLFVLSLAIAFTFIFKGLPKKKHNK